METTDESDGRSPKVVIVGAGYAGVAAAGVLRAGGITDVTVLEAQGRPGGRVQTLQLEDGHLEIGAQFLHGQNEIYAIAERENNLLDDEEGEEAEILPDTVLQYHEYDFYTPGGHLVDGHVVLENLRALEELNNKARSEGVASDVMVSLGDFFRDRYTDVMSTTPGEDWVKGSMLKWFESWAKMDSGGTVDEQSLPGTGKYAYVPGSGVQETKTGMEEVFKCLLRESLPPENLLLNKPVKKIHWTEKAVDSAESETVDENSSKRERTKELYKEVDENWSKPERTKESGLELDKDSSDDERTKVFAGTNFISGETKPSAGDQADAAVTGLSIHMEKSGATIDENDADDSGMESSASKTTPETSDDEKTEDFKERN
nr:hypothetical protein BaRGS_013396 [Batillaria attramentaria]